MLVNKACLSYSSVVLLLSVKCCETSTRVLVVEHSMLHYVFDDSNRMIANHLLC